MNKRKKPNWGLRIILGVAIVYLGFVLIKQQGIIYNQHVELKQIQAKIEKEKELNKKLVKQKEEVSSDEYIEKIAREKLGMVRHGERVFVDANN
ncbi:MAG: FtsB family cell division protein [Bacillota bacterium]